MTSSSAGVDRPPAIGQQEVSAGAPETSSLGGDGAARWDQGFPTAEMEKRKLSYTGEEKGVMG